MIKKMKILIIFIVLITILKCCVCDTRKKCEATFIKDIQPRLMRQYEYHSKKEGELVSLLKSTLGYDKLNQKFELIASKLNFVVAEVEYFCDNSLIATEIVAKYFENVVNLRVKNVYLDTHLPETLMYIGNIDIYEQCINVWYCNNSNIADKTIPINENTIHRGNNTADNDTDTKSTDTFPCTVVDECKKMSNSIIKVASKTLEKYKELVELLNVLDETHDPINEEYWLQHATTNLYKNSVVICTEEQNEFMENFIYGGYIIRYNYKEVEDCHLTEFNNSYMLGIIAPRPMALMSILTVPSIFYDVPKILPEHKYEYPNSAVVHGNYYKHLTAAAIKFIELAKYIRIGVLSDISAYSVDFEAMLTSALDKKKIVYAVKQCWDKTCDFHEALNEFVRVQAMIIILNVDKEYAIALVKAAHKLRMNSKHGYMWIWRGWPFEDDTGAAHMGEVYSLDIMYGYAPEDHGHIIASNINKAIIAFEEALEGYDNNFDLFIQNKTMRYSEMITRIEAKLDEEKLTSVVYLRKINSKGAKKMYTFTITDDDVTSYIIHKEVTFLDLPPAMECAVRSNKFEQPCDDRNLGILLLVILSFIIFSIFIYIMFSNKNGRMP